MTIDAEVLRRVVGPALLSDSECCELASQLLRPPSPAIRVRSSDPAIPLPFASTPVTWHDRGRWVAVDAKPGARLEFAAGEYYIQDAGSLLSVALLDVQPGDLVCDLCAAPGGKSTAILEDLRGDGWLLANESIRARLPALEFNLARHGSPRFAVSQLDPETLAERLGPIFDAVLVDAPCSGQTLYGRGKQSVASFSARQIEHSAARQERILDAASKLVAPGGRLVYSTCTFAVMENEEQVERFLRCHTDWRIEPSLALEAWQSPRLSNAYRLWPHRDGCAGAFAVRLRRESNDFPAGNTARQTSREIRRPGTIGINDLDAWGELKEVEVRGDHQRCFAWPHDVPDEFIDIAYSGPEVAYRKGTTWFPSYSLAMRRDPNWHPHAELSLDDQTALRFVRGEAIPAANQGWAAACWRGRSFAWVKGDGRFARNHLPKPARIGHVIEPNQS